MPFNPIISSVDPITFEILSHRLYQIAKEMGTALERVGGTVNTTQMHDYMASLLKRYVKVRDFSPRCTSSVIITVLFYAAARMAYRRPLPPSPGTGLIIRRLRPSCRRTS